MDKITQIKQTTDICELVGQYVDLRPNGRTMVGCCPFHGERTPSFHVYPRDGHYHCFGCGAHGDVVSFYAQMENISTKEAVHRLYVDGSRAGEGGDMPSKPANDSQAGMPALHVPWEQVRAAECHSEETSLYRFLMRHFRRTDVERVLAQYAVGASRYENPDGGRAATLPYINRRQEVVDVKIMHFSPITGSRKDAPPLHDNVSQTWALAQAKQSHRRAPWTLFGAHLLEANAHKPAAIVESEKTALICSILRPECLWLACGGKSNLTAQRLEDCRGHKIRLYPDRDAMNDWTAAAYELRRKGLDVEVEKSLMRHQHGAHDDLADVLLRENQQRLDQMWEELKRRRPQLAQLDAKVHLFPVAADDDVTISG